jgi:hypothetical protein
MANAIIVDDAGRLVPHRRTKRGKLVGHTDVTIKLRRPAHRGACSQPASEPCRRQALSVVTVP